MRSTMTRRSCTCGGVRHLQDGRYARVGGMGLMVIGRLPGPSTSMGGRPRPGSRMLCGSFARSTSPPASPGWLAFWRGAIEGRRCGEGWRAEPAETFDVGTRSGLAPARRRVATDLCAGGGSTGAARRRGAPARGGRRRTRANGRPLAACGDARGEGGSRVRSWRRRTEHSSRCARPSVLRVTAARASGWLSQSS